MRSLVGILAASVLSTGLMVGIVAAAPANTNTSGNGQCSIYTFDSESYNSCISNSDQNVQVTCVNDTYVLNNNSQTAGTGGATITNNGSGNAASGSATNTSGDTVTIGTSCGTPAPTATTTTTIGTGSGSTTTPAATPTPQVVAPVGAVEAGYGGGSRTSNLAIAGLITSAGAVGLGSVLLRKRVFGK